MILSQGFANKIQKRYHTLLYTLFHYKNYSDIKNNINLLFTTSATLLFDFKALVLNKNQYRDWFYLGPFVTFFYCNSYKIIGKSQKIVELHLTFFFFKYEMTLFTLILYSPSPAKFCDPCL